MIDLGQVQITRQQTATVLPLHSSMDVAARHWLLGLALDRIAKFARQYDADANPDVMIREIEADFAKKQDHNFFIVVGMRNGEMVGHLLSNLYDYYGYRYVYVNQMHIDESSGITIAQERDAFGWIESWARESRAVGIRTAAPSLAHVRRLRMLHGFSPKLTVMKWDGQL